MQKFIQINPVEAKPMKRNEFYLLAGKTSFNTRDDEPGYTFKDSKVRAVWQPANLFEKNHIALPDSFEKVTGLRKLLEAKDYMIRTVL